MKSVFTFLAVLFLFIILSPSVKAQGVGNPGQIITTSFANAQFGLPIESFSFNRKALINILRKSRGYIMFGYRERMFIITDNKRNVIFPEGALVSKDEVLHNFGMDVMEDFLSRLESNKVNIEMRPGGVLTISEDKPGEADGVTLEYSIPCPPLCPW